MLTLTTLSYARSCVWFRCSVALVPWSMCIHMACGMLVKRSQRVNKQDETFYNVAGVTVLNTTSMEMEFMQYISGPFGTSKFMIRKDPMSARYYSLSTNVTNKAAAVHNYGARNNLVLAVSEDLLTWRVCQQKALLTDDTGLSDLDSARYTGFEYPDFAFSGGDIVATIRTAYRGAVSSGSSNRITFLRVRGYAAQCA
eukprot:m.125257 g.125257  ORF g.125257 m.125257 type:complete len:198 (-) comp17318_c0_seq3:476-1069(-)